MIDKLLENRKLIITLIIIGALIFVLWSIIPFLAGIFGALAIYFLFRPLDKWLTNTVKLSKHLTAIIIIIISIILIILPISFIFQGLIKEVGSLSKQIEKLENLNASLPFNIEIDKNEIQTRFVEILSQSTSPILSNVLNVGIILFLMFFLLYYIVVYDKLIKRKIIQVMPFSEKNKIRVIQKFKDVTYGAIVGTFIIALVQGGLLTINFYLLGIPNALFWGFVTMILSFLPIIGPPIIWVPAAILLFMSGELGKAVAIVIAGIMISSIDNVIRPMINIKFGSIHPIISIVGIYIGIASFGIAGIFIGPLILVYLLLFWEMYKENYIIKGKKLKIP
ncbi:AI-2E family transporter [Candidatus Pacearchaeota archaeon]|nr:AI-2E family transporter [Candidatus Pacearchaeota archaeon]